MSEIPPPETPPTVPYATPPIDPAQKVSGPATGLIVVGALGIAAQIFGMLYNLLVAGSGAAAGKEGMANMFSGVFGLVFNVIAIIMGVVVILGALKMKKLQSYGFAMAVSIIAMIPCISPCCWIGLPIGIWALVVLLKPEVKAAFSGGAPSSGFPTA